MDSKIGAILAMNGDEPSLIWLIVCTCVAFFMQVGFTLVETGSVRAKNSVNVAMKNLADFVVVSFVYLFLGFHLANGSSFFSLETFPLTVEYYGMAMFSIMFVTTAATIVSGCVAERMSFRGYLYASAFIGILTYPVVSYWTWNPNSWLASLDFHDFAGGATVHIVGGLFGLIGTILIGPRYDRFSETNEAVEIPSYNHTLVTIGVFMMVFGWLGFNGGSFYEFNNDVPKVLLNTLLGGVTSGFFALLFLQHKPHIPVFLILNCILGGLVIVTAGADVLNTYQVVVLGAIAALTIFYGEKLLIYLKIDDPVGAVPVHLFCGILGVLFTGYAANSNSSGWPMYIGVQLLGIIVIVAWVAVNAYVLFLFLKSLDLHRVSLDKEKMGLNVAEHGVKMSWLETVKSIEDISTSGDYTKRAPIECGTEAGDVAIAFNYLMGDLEKNIEALHHVAKGNLDEVVVFPRSDKDILARSLQSMLVSLRSLLAEVEDEITTQNEQLQSNENSIKTLIENFKHTQDQLMEAEKMSALTGMVVGVAHELNTPLGISVTSLSLLREQFLGLEKKFTDQTITTTDLTHFLNISNDCIKMISDNIERSVTLVNKLKQVDKKMSLEQPANINIRMLLEESVMLLKDILAQQDIEVEIHCEDTLELFVPKMSLQYVIEELLNNCALHGFQNRDQEKSNSINITAQSVNSHVEIVIEDNGVGISPDNLKKVFQPFYTTLRARGGTGLGMHMVYNICTRKLSGNINVKSEIGKGTKITITINEHVDKSPHNESEESASVPPQLK